MQQPDTRDPLNLHSRVARNEHRARWSVGWVNAEAGYPLAGAAEEDGVIQPAQFVHSFVLVSARAYR
jgi:hypothetical protein